MLNSVAGSASNGCYVAVRDVAGSDVKRFTIAVLLALLVACGEPAPPEEAPEHGAGASPPVAPEPGVAAPVAAAREPTAPAPAEPAPPSVKPPPVRESASGAPPPAPVVVASPPAEAPPAPEPPPEAAPAPPLALDLDGLEKRLKDTSALGVLTKLSLKNEIDDLIDDVGRFHRKQRGELAALRERFELLLMKVTSLLQEKEPELAREVAGAREGLWKLLADPGEFAKLSA